MNHIRTNKQAYESSSAVSGFPSDADIQEPEKAILRELTDFLQAADMLDIGVGTGRTTRFFAPIVDSYTGMDYSSSMVDACTQSFPKYPFKVSDASAMKEFEDHSFNFLLFSYNGIDVLDHQRRLQVFSEIKRLAKAGSKFAFSTHNLFAAKKLLTCTLHRNPKRLYENIRRYLLNRLHNPSYTHISTLDYAVIHEVSHFLKLHQYYIKPSAQIAQLTEAGFTNINVYNLGGNKVPHEQLQYIDDPWIYYLCDI